MVLTKIKRWVGDLLAIAIYPLAVIEMLASLRSRSYINHYAVHKSSVRLYNKTRGLTELVENYIFGIRPWKLESKIKAIDSLSPEFSKNGWSLVDINLDVNDLRDELLIVPFRSRLHKPASATLKELSFLEAQGRWDADQTSLFSVKSFAALITNQSIQSLASCLLGDFVITSAVVWASFACATEDDRIASAQVFHVDHDYLDDIKLFVHLSDTWANDGPLEYITGTNHRKAKRIWSSAPISESAIHAFYSSSTHAFFTGLTGSVYISDNRGLHRDRPPLPSKSKLALQINFSRSQFGSEKAYASHRPRLSSDWPSFLIWQTAFEANPLAFSLLFSRGACD